MLINYQTPFTCTLRYVTRQWFQSDTINAILQAMEYKWNRKKLWGYNRRFMRLICWIHTGLNYLYRPSERQQTNECQWTSPPFTTLSFQIPSLAMTSCAVGLVKSQSLLLGLGLCSRPQVETVLLGDTAVANWVTQAKNDCYLTQCGYSKCKGLETACWGVVNNSVLYICTSHTVGSRSQKP